MFLSQALQADQLCDTGEDGDWTLDQRNSTLFSEALV